MSRNCLGKFAKGRFTTKDLKAVNKWGKVSFGFDGVDEETGFPIDETLSMKTVKIFEGDSPTPANPSDYSYRSFTGRIMYDTFDYEGRTCYKVYAIQVCHVDPSELMPNPFIGKAKPEAEESNLRENWGNEDE